MQGWRSSVLATFSRFFEEAQQGSDACQKRHTIPAQSVIHRKYGKMPVGTCCLDREYLLTQASHHPDFLDQSFGKP